MKQNVWRKSSYDSIYRPKGEWVYGYQPVAAVLKSRKRSIYNMFLKNEVKFSFEPLVREYLDATGRDPVVVNQDFFGNILQDNNHQGIALDCSPISPGVIDYLTRDHIDNSRERNVWVVLHEVQDPHNLGAILRNCVFYGVVGVVLSSKHSASLSNVVAKVSSGALEYQPIYEVGSIRRFLSNSKEFGWQIIGTSCSNVNSGLRSIDATLPSVVVFGNEGKGLSDAILAECDKIVNISSSSDIDSTVTSLNVSVTTGIVLNTLCHLE